jgi:hypothetical protein
MALGNKRWLKNAQSQPGTVGWKKKKDRTHTDC